MPRAPRRRPADSRAIAGRVQRRAQVALLGKTERQGDGGTNREDRKGHRTIAGAGTDFLSTPLGGELSHERRTFLHAARREDRYRVRRGRSRPSAPEVSTVLRARRYTSGGRTAPQSLGDESRGTSLVHLRARAARGPERAHRFDESVPGLPCPRVGGTFRVAPHLLATLSVRRFSAALAADD